MLRVKLATVGLLSLQKILPSVIKVGGTKVVASKLADIEVPSVPPQPEVVDVIALIVIVVVPPVVILAAGITKVPMPLQQSLVLIPQQHCWLH